MCKGFSNTSSKPRLMCCLLDRISKQNVHWWKTAQLLGIYFSNLGNTNSEIQYFFHPHWQRKQFDKKNSMLAFSFLMSQRSSSCLCSAGSLHFSLFSTYSFNISSLGVVWFGVSLFLSGGGGGGGGLDWGFLVWLVFWGFLFGMFFCFFLFYL